MPDTRTIVVVGGVAGGASAAARARRVNEKARIVILERDHHVSFANCGLPYYLGGEITKRDKLLVAKPQRFNEWLNVEVRTRHQVTAIDRPRKVVKVLERDSGQEYELAYDKLILSPGADPIMPPVPGIHAVNVFTLRNLADADRIKALLEQPVTNTSAPPRRAVVVGAGFIGLEMVEMLVHLGVHTTLVELVDQVLPPLDKEMAAIIEAELVRHGVTLKLGAGLAGFTLAGDHATHALVSDGSQVACDLAIVGVGVRPNVALAKEAGLTIGATGGIHVNEHMQTSDPAIYAAGDAVEYHHGVLGSDMRVPLAGPANRAGRIAGEHAAADHAPKMPPVLGTAIVRVFAVTAAITGLSNKAADRAEVAHHDVWLPGNHHAGYYPGAQEMITKLTYAPADGRVLGAQIVGGAGVDKRIDVIASVLHFGGTVDDLTELDLSYAPPFGSAKDPAHMAGFVAQNARRGLDTHVSPLAAHDLPVGTQILDVRNPDEWQAGHLDGAIWIPLAQLRERLGELDKTRPVVTVCRGGQRAYYATRILRQNGFGDVRTLAGGMLLQQYVLPLLERSVS